jgi:hypothetical protein
MSPADWMVIAAGIAAIAWINWYFFLGGPAGGDPDGNHTP